MKNEGSKTWESGVGCRKTNGVAVCVTKKEIKTESPSSFNVCKSRKTYMSFNLFLKFGDCRGKKALPSFN